jgi:hypothetical protein
MAQQYDSKDQANSVNQNYTVRINFGENGRGAVTIKGTPVREDSRVKREENNKGKR